MANVIWLGGGCGAGKSTIARWLAYRYDLRLYPVDAYGYAHERRAVGEPGWPVMRRAAGLSFARRWLEPSLAQQVEAFWSHAVERFAMVAEELAALPDGPPTVVEGPQLLPHLVAAAGPAPGRALWLLPSDGFTDRVRHGRGFRGPAGEADLRRVLATLIARDRAITARLRAGTAAAGLASLPVDGTRDLPAMRAAVVDHLAPVLAGLPPVDGATRRRMRRAENAAVAANLAAYQEAIGAGPPPAGPFVCECATPGCAVQRDLDAATYRATAPLALCGR